MPSPQEVPGQGHLCCFPVADPALVSKPSPPGEVLSDDGVPRSTSAVLDTTCLCQCSVPTTGTAPGTLWVWHNSHHLYSRQHLTVIRCRVIKKVNRGTILKAHGPLLAFLWTHIQLSECRPLSSGTQQRPSVIIAWLHFSGM